MMGAMEICAMQMRGRRRRAVPDRCGPSRRDNKHLIVRVQRGMFSMLKVGNRALEHCECNGPVSQFRGSAFSARWLGAMSCCRRETPTDAEVPSQAAESVHNEGQRNNGGGLSATSLRQSLRIASICSLAVVQR